MAPDAGAYAPLVAPVGTLSRGAGVVAGIGVDACLEAEAVDVIDEGTEPVREFLGMDEQMAIDAVAVAEVTVVDVDVFVAGILERGVGHSVGLLADELLVDVDAVGVP